MAEGELTRRGAAIAVAAGEARARDRHHHPPAYVIFIPEMARATTSRWISDVPSKIV